MRTIYKYPLLVGNIQSVSMSINAKILCVQVQGETICLWAEVDSDDLEHEYNRHFRIIGTGHPIDQDEDLEYIGTVQLFNGSLIFHVFEQKN